MSLCYLQALAKQLHHLINLIVLQQTKALLPVRGSRTGAGAPFSYERGICVKRESPNKAKIKCSLSKALHVIIRCVSVLIMEQFRPLLPTHKAFPFCTPLPLEGKMLHWPRKSKRCGWKYKYELQGCADNWDQMCLLWGCCSAGQGGG